MSATRRDEPSDYDELEPVEAEELDTLEPVEDDDLDVLEPIDDDASPVTVSHAPGDDAETDLRVDVHVPEMPKPEVADAVRGPLERFAAARATELRWRRVRVVFGGDALIGTAVKELVATALKPAKPARVVVVRGYGEETVHEAAPPAMGVDVTPDAADPSRVRIAVRGDDLEGADLAAALRDRFDALLADAAGKAVDFVFPMVAPRALRDEIGARFAASSAKRLTIDGKLIFDRELESRVRVGIVGDAATLDVTPAADADVTRAAFDMVLPGAAASLAGRDVTVRFHGREPRAAELGELLERLRAAGATGVAIAGVGGVAIDVLWPEVLKTVRKDDRTGLRVVPGDRDRGAVAAALRREIASLGADLAGQRVQVDWPKGYAVDAELARAVVDAIVAHGPREVAFSVAGQDREPVWPLPVAFREEHDGYGAIQVVDLDLDAGKPVEVLRAAARQVQAHQAGLRDQRIRVAVRGEGALSGSIVRGIDEVFGAPEPRWLEVESAGRRDVLRPALLAVAQVDGGLRVTADPSGRQPDQVRAALLRELAAVDVTAAATVYVTPSSAADDVVAAVVEGGANRVVLDGPEPVQVHPQLFAAPVHNGELLVLSAQGDGDDPAVGRQAAREVRDLLGAVGDLGERTVVLAWEGAVDPSRPAVALALDAIRAAGAPRAVLDAGDASLPLRVWPAIDVTLVEVIGRRSGAEPPLVMVAVRLCEDLGGERATVEQLEALGAVAGGELDGARVLVVCRDDAGDEIDVADELPQCAAALSALRAVAAAVLVRRPGGPAGQPCFEVVASKLPGLRRGARTRDPRIVSAPEPEASAPRGGSSEDGVEPVPVDEAGVVDPAGVPDAAPPVDDGSLAAADDEDLPTLDLDLGDDDGRDDASRRDREA